MTNTESDLGELIYYSGDMMKPEGPIRIRVLRSVPSSDSTQFLEVEAKDLKTIHGAEMFLITALSRADPITLNMRGGIVLVFLCEHDLAPNGTVDVLQHKSKILDKGNVRLAPAK